MHFSTTLLPLTFLVSYASAQTIATAPAVPTVPATGSGSSSCQGQNVLNACLSSTTAIAQACQSTDYTCLCTSWNAVLTCYNECPDDAGYSGALSNKQTYCNNASLYASTSSSAISRDWPSSTTAGAAATGTDGSGSSATAGTGFVTTGNAAKASGASKTASASGSQGSDKSSGAGPLRVGGGGVGGTMGVLGGVGAVVAWFL